MAIGLLTYLIITGQNPTKTRGLPLMGGTEVLTGLLGTVIFVEAHKGSSIKTHRYLTMFGTLPSDLGNDCTEFLDRSGAFRMNGQHAACDSCRAMQRYQGYLSLD